MHRFFFHDTAENVTTQMTSQVTNCAGGDVLKPHQTDRPDLAWAHQALDILSKPIEQELVLEDRGGSATYESVKR